MLKIVFPKHHDAGSSVEIVLDEHPVTVEAGQPLAAALMKAGLSVFRRTPVSGAPRAPYCMMGVCFECLVEIDGVPNQQSCMVEVREGMRVRVQDGARKLEPTR